MSYVTKRTPKTLTSDRGFTRAFWIRTARRSESHGHRFLHRKIQVEGKIGFPRADETMTIVACLHSSDSLDVEKACRSHRF